MNRSVLVFFHFHELLLLFPSGVDMIAEPNVMQASGRCHKAKDCVNIKSRKEGLCSAPQTAKMLHKQEGL